MYQKKYLLLLLGGFHETEASTLALVAAPAARGVPASRREVAVRRWRKAGMALIGVARLRILLHKWRR